MQDMHTHQSKNFRTREKKLISSTCACLGLEQLGLGAGTRQKNTQKLETYVVG